MEAEKPLVRGLTRNMLWRCALGNSSQLRARDHSGTGRRATQQCCTSCTSWCASVCLTRLLALSLHFVMLG